MVRLCRDGHRDRPRPPQRRLTAARGAAAAVCLVLFAGPPRPCLAGPNLTVYQTRYYVIHTDLPLDAVREAAVRLTAMAEEYHRRTRGFSGAIRRKLPFYLFGSAEDYHDAGGPPGSAGAFTGRRLMAFAGRHPGPRTWHVIQHEGFHQFAHAVIRGKIPVWVNEGLAEYFGQGIFTGDGFVVGVVPPDRLARLKKRIQAGTLREFRQMMSMDNRDWTGQIRLGDYDQAWSMIHFLVHADRGRYVRALSEFMNDIGRRMRHEQAWLRNFGRDLGGFEARWRQYWLSQPADPARGLYHKAVVATMTSFFARAASQRQEFATFEEFLRAARAGELKAHQLDWLPPRLLSETLASVRRSGEWSIRRPRGKLPRIVCRAADGTTFAGTFAIRDGRVSRVSVQVSNDAHSGTPTTTPASAGPSTVPATR